MAPRSRSGSYSGWPPTLWRPSCRDGCRFAPGLLWRRPSASRLLYATFEASRAPLAAEAVEGFLPLVAAWFVGDSVADAAPLRGGTRRAGRAGAGD